MSVKSSPSLSIHCDTERLWKIAVTRMMCSTTTFVTKPERPLKLVEEKRFSLCLEALPCAAVTEVKAQSRGQLSSIRRGGDEIA